MHSLNCKKILLLVTLRYYDWNIVCPWPLMRMVSLVHPWHITSPWVNDWLWKIYHTFIVRVILVAFGPLDVLLKILGFLQSFQLNFELSEMNNVSNLFLPLILIIIMCAASCNKVPNGLSHCHPKKRIDPHGHNYLYFGMTPNFKNLILLTSYIIF